VTETVQWIDAVGATTTLEVEWAVSGRFMPRIEHQSEGVPGQAGERFRSARHGVHEFTVPAWVQAGTEAALRTALRDLVDVMDPTRGAGRVRVTSPLSDQREITCFYTSGLEVEEKLGDTSGPDSQLVPITFTAFDPYWYDVSPMSSTYAVSETPSFFPLFPLRLTSSEIAVDTTVTNDGSVETWPVWTLDGPGSVIKLRNLTTGQDIYLPSLTLESGQTLTIDTRPGVKSVRINDDNAYPELDTTSTLWPLARGGNAISLEMSGTTLGVSQLRLNFWRRYLSP
jgi:phage-related protein